MPTFARDIPGLVAIFLPYNAEAASAAYDAPDVEVPAASMASFSVSARYAISRMNRQERMHFCRRVATQGEDNLQAWMVEAVLRGIEGNQDALAGTDPSATIDAHLYGLAILSAEYLTAQECEGLRSEAVSLARELLPGLAALPQD